MGVLWYLLDLKLNKKFPLDLETKKTTMAGPETKWSYAGIQIKWMKQVGWLNFFDCTWNQKRFG